MAVQAAEVEAKDRLADPIALRLWVGLELLEAGAVDKLGDHDPLVRERRDHIRDDDERMAAEDPRQRPLVLGLQLVVELLGDPRPDLLADRLWIHSRRDPLGQPQDQPEVLHVGLYGYGDD